MSATAPSVAGPWTSGPACPRLGEGSLHIWLADLDTFAPDAPDVLSPDERERAAVIVREPARTRWSTARALLRLVLAAYTGVEPEALVLVEGEHGKPSLAPLAGAAPEFNLAHSRHLALVALAQAGPVGVDIEVHRAPHRADRLREWTRTEAAMKLRGEALARERDGPQGASTWVCELDLGGVPATAAVALDREPAPVCLWRWPPQAG
jgi:phosphopantetheinyl transferase